MRLSWADVPMQCKRGTFQPNLRPIHQWWIKYTMVTYIHKQRGTMEKVYGDTSFHLPWPLYVAGMMPIYIGRHGGQLQEPVSTNLVIGSTTVLCYLSTVHYSGFWNAYLLTLYSLCSIGLQVRLQDRNATQATRGSICC